MQAEALVTTTGDRTSSTDPASLSTLARGALALLSLVGLGIAAYLLFLSLAKRGLPAGCGQGSGCDEVLNSRW
ncbi:MAG TPA: hypothetical protein VHX68_10200, partial [Planctomycetaceae bacterium]|nr:hypothetical protein [Planctomycetaceae bacterium]